MESSASEVIAMPTLFGLWMGVMLFILMLVDAWIQRALRSRPSNAMVGSQVTAVELEIEGWEDEGGSVLPERSPAQ